MEPSRKLDVAILGILVTIILAVIAFAFWLGHLDSRVAGLEGGEAEKALKQLTDQLHELQESALPEYAVFFEEQPFNSSSPGKEGWQIRTLTSGDAGLSKSIKLVGNSTIMLQPGSYYIDADADSYRDNRSQLILRDVTNGSSPDPANDKTIICGLSTDSGSGAGEFSASVSSLKGIVTITGTSHQYQLWHYLAGIKEGASALGMSTNNLSKVNNRYAQITIIRFK